MRTTRPHVGRVQTAGWSGSDRPSEDRVLTSANAVIVLDGASHPNSSREHDGGWLADVLGRELRSRLDVHDGDLASVLAGSIDAVARRYDLQPNQGPSTTVSIVRWTDVAVDVLVLGDSPVVAITRQGHVSVLRDDRLKRVAAEQRRSLWRHEGGAGERQDAWWSLVEAERAQRNKPDGYWIADAVPEAAYHARRARWDLRDLRAVLAMSDGVSAGVDRYGVPPDWVTAYALAEQDPARLLEAVHAAEESDPDCRRWSRSKQHDDKTVALIQFNP